MTATPHSGNEQAFQSLVGLLDDAFANLPEDLEAKIKLLAFQQLPFPLINFFLCCLSANKPNGNKERIHTERFYDFATFMGDVYATQNR